ncbi:MAG: 50S ribosomal protein L24 [Clostridiales bacterium]
MAYAKTHIRKDDKVMIITGKDAGKTGKVIQVLPGKGKVIVDGVNIVKRHTKPTQSNPQGGIMEKPAAIDASNVMLYCGKCKKVTRIQMKSLSDAANVRVCKHCGEVFDK